MKTLTRHRGGTPLRVVHNTLSAPKEEGKILLSPKMQVLVNAAFAITIIALWNGIRLSPAAVCAIRNSIQNFLLSSTDRQCAYNEYVHRILQARVALRRRPLPPPEVWFNCQNTRGFARTEKWYRQLQKKRQSMPLHLQCLKVLAEALVDMQENPSAQNFHYWRVYFIERNWHRTLNLFLSALATMQFDRD